MNKPSLNAFDQARGARPCPSRPRRRDHGSQRRSDGYGLARLLEYGCPAMSLVLWLLRTPCLLPWKRRQRLILQT
jgi:hypothetical protein